MAEANPNIMGGGPEGLTRRTLLGGLPAAGAALALPLFDGDAAFLPSGGGSNDLAHPVLQLPFVREPTDTERAAGQTPRCFWAVDPTGHYSDDCRTGGHYAHLAVDYMLREHSPQILQWAVFDMMRLGRAHTGIEVGFMSFFGHLATDAWAAKMGHGEGDMA